MYQPGNSLFIEQLKDRVWTPAFLFLYSVLHGPARFLRSVIADLVRAAPAAAGSRTCGTMITAGQGSVVHEQAQITAVPSAFRFPCRATEKDQQCRPYFLRR
ncbi:hypothetical protein [Streptomyces sp. AC602_WCS936]|uniref:hypothetical protein n=1 Tax=Streptomyces sp. AC602_WCS936 TaxID=2823685 RepID=UPI001C260365|nr:hypothetical protein [Streptomyces sp. AC602_WCS936]